MSAVNEMKLNKQYLARDTITITGMALELIIEATWKAATQKERERQSIPAALSLASTHPIQETVRAAGDSETIIPKPKKLTPKIARNVLNTVSMRGGAYPSWIAAAFELRYETAKALLDAWVYKGYMARTKNGIYKAIRTPKESDATV